LSTLILDFTDSNNSYFVALLVHLMSESVNYSTVRDIVW